MVEGTSTTSAGDQLRVLKSLGPLAAGQEVVTLADSAGNLLGASGAPLPTSPAVSTTGTITSPALAITSFTVLAVNTNRKMATFFNDSANTLYLALAATASTTSYTVQVPPGGYYELPGTSMIYTGLVTGISTVASGNVRVTELT